MKHCPHYKCQFWLRAALCLSLFGFVSLSPFAASAQDYSMFGDQAAQAREKRLINALLAEAAYTGRPQVGEWQKIDLPHAGKDGGVHDPDSGFDAYAYKNPKTGQVVISFRGTESANDARTDAQQLEYGAKKTAQYQLARSLAAEMKELYGVNNLSVTGHSLGGGLAQFVSMAVGVPGFGFNSAPLSDNSLEYAVQLRNANGLPTVAPEKLDFSNTIIRGEVVNHLGSHDLGTITYVDRFKEDTPYMTSYGYGDLKVRDQSKLGIEVGADDPDNRIGLADNHGSGTLVKALAEESRHLAGLAATFAEDGRMRLVLERQADIASRVDVRNVDVFFLADNTGSMGGLISTVQSNAESILNRLNSRSISVRINYGVGRYYGDPTEWGETPTSAYQLQQRITSDRDTVRAAINAWSASGGGDWEEANFYALQQAATSGAGTPRDGSKATLQSTGWRSGAARVIIIFGDAPSWQKSVTEKELRAVLKDTNVRVCFIDSQSLNASGSAASTWDSTTGTQLAGAGQELAEGTNGVYVNVSGFTAAKIVDAVVNAVNDAMSDNPWGGAHLARIDASKTWRNKAPSAVEGDSLANTVSLTLRSPGQDDSLFSFDTSSGTLVPGKIWYTKEIGTYPTLFWTTFDPKSIIDFTSTLDFYRFDLRQNGSPSVTQLAGYFGKNWSGTPGTRYYLYDLTSWAVNPGWTGGTSRSGSDSMRLAVNWDIGRVYGAEPSPPGFDGFGFYIGKMDASGKISDGVYVTKSQRYETNPVYTSYVQDSGRGNTLLSFYGSAEPLGVGGTFSTVWYDQNRSGSGSSVMLSGFASAKGSPPVWANGATYSGFTAGLVQDRSSGATQLLASNALSDVNIRFVDYGISADVSASAGGTSYGVSIGSSDYSVLASPQMFGGVKTVNSAPAYVATAMSGQEGYSYMSWGYWSVDSNVGGSTKTVFPKTPWIAGRVTTGAEVGTISGTAHYYGDVRGVLSEAANPTAPTTLTGTTTLTATFGAAPVTLSGSFNDLKRADGTTWMNTASLSAASPGGGALSGSVSGSTTGGTAMSGSVNGSFFGPRAQEVGGNWGMTNAGATTKAGGVFNAKQ